MMVRFVLIMLLSVLFGCASGPQKPEKLLGGLYIYGDEVDIVKLCGSDDAYWVWANPEVQQELSNHLTIQRNQAFFIEFSGDVLKAQRDDLAGHHDGLVRIDRIIQFSQHAPRQCQ